MMNGIIGAVGQVSVMATQNRGHTPEELAVMCVDKIIGISDTAPPAIRDQALAYKARVLVIVEHYMRQAVISDRTTTSNKLKSAGFDDLSAVARRL